ncbi:MAG: hypothetical protein V9G13_13855 [Marmoricola sp.]
MSYINASTSYTLAFNTLCDFDKTFARALIDQTGDDKRVLRLSSAQPDWRLTRACDMTSFRNSWGTAKSTMSYAPYNNNFNSFLEPLDYQAAIGQLCNPASLCPGYKSAPVSAPMGLMRPNGPVAVTRTLRLSGKIDVSDTVTTSLSYVAINEGEVTPQEPQGTYHLIVRDAGNIILHDQVFDLSFEESGLTKTVAFFNLRVPFPVNAVTAEVRHDNAAIWSRTVSANAPTVNFITPNGGTVNAANVVTVTWTANDVNGDALQFGLDYSADNGTTWTMIDPRLSGHVLSMDAQLRTGQQHRALAAARQRWLQRRRGDIQSVHVDPARAGRHHHVARSQRLLHRGQYRDAGRRVRHRRRTESGRLHLAAQWRDAGHNPHHHDRAQLDRGAHLLALGGQRQPAWHQHRLDHRRGRLRPRHAVQ